MWLGSGRLRRRLSGGRTLDAAICHHADQARGIPARHDLLVVGSGIHVGLSALQDRMDHAGQLVGGGEDGLLVALPRLEGAEAVVLEQDPGRTPPRPPHAARPSPKMDRRTHRPLNLANAP